MRESAGCSWNTKPVALHSMAQHSMGEAGQVRRHSTQAILILCKATKAAGHSLHIGGFVEGLHAYTLVGCKVRIVHALQRCVHGNRLTSGTTCKALSKRCVYSCGSPVCVFHHILGHRPWVEVTQHLGGQRTCLAHTVAHTAHTQGSRNDC
jgi:hypothetical protein